MAAGTKVQLRNGRAIPSTGNFIGVIDPFLETVEEGNRCWLLWLFLCASHRSQRLLPLCARRALTQET